MRLLRRIAYWLRLSSHHEDLIDELSFHREMIVQELIGRGLSPTAAHAEARRRMGPELSMREEARAVWLWPALEALVQDAKYVLRDLRRHPAFTVGVVLTLALGIGANAAMFGLVDRLLLRPPERMIDPGRVHRVHMYRTVEGQERERDGIYARYVDMARWTTAFAQTAAATLRPLAVGRGQETQLRNVAIVSAGFFGFFDAPPALGRYYTPAEDAPPDPAPVAVISDALWRTRFGARGDVIGARLQIDAVEYTIVGVAPEGFVGLWPYQPPAAFIPVATYAANRRRPQWATSYGTAFGLKMLVRRRPGVAIEAANADLTRALRRSYQAEIDANPGYASLDELRPRALAASVLAERGPDRSSVARTATWLSGVTLIVLLIACANVINLLLARTIRRRREIAVRVALGVGRGRLLRQLLTEGIVLALLGGMAALAFAVWSGDVLRALFLPGTDRVSLLTDARTLLFAGAVVLGVGVLIGLVPLVQVAGGQDVADLRSSAREGVHRRTTLQRGLILFQCTLSVVLLIGATLFVRSLRNVRDVPLGFDADSVLVASLTMRDVRLDSAATVALRLRLLRAAESIPGVSHATLQESIPFAGMSSWPIFVPGLDSADDLGDFHVNMVSADYFRTMGTRIVRGRAIEDADRAGAIRVAVVGESMAAALWPGEDPIGRCFRVSAETLPCTYVVGVAEDIRSQSFEAESKLFFYYLPSAQWQPQEGGLFVRTQGPASRMVEQVRRHLQREMPGTSFVAVRPLADIIDGERRSWIVGATLFTALGALALVLAALGLYSVLAYDVTLRRHELGVRLALGAAPAGIVRLVAIDGLRVALAGVALGSLGALALGRWIGPLLFHQSPRDPAVIALASALLLGVAVVASCAPALRAAAVDPRTALDPV